MTVGSPIERRTRIRTALMSLVLIATAVGLNACGGGEDDSAAAAASPSSNPSASPPSGTNRSPAISGAPLLAVTQGTQYTFTPSASDPDGDALTFSIQGKPAWATFSTTNGRLQGTPGATAVGSTGSIAISVTDGAATATLASFAINVMGTAPTGSVTLSWNAPTTNTDGSPIGNSLAGYKIYWGTTPGSYSNTDTVGVGVATYVVEQLAPARWYFAVTALNALGAESAPSNEASRTL